VRAIREFGPQLFYEPCNRNIEVTPLSKELHRTLNNACRKWGAREIRLRYLPKPSLNRWIAEAIIDPHQFIEKIRIHIPHVCSETESSDPRGIDLDRPPPFLRGGWSPSLAPFLSRTRIAQKMITTPLSRKS
jgi:hypothetical protein